MGKKDVITLQDMRRLASIEFSPSEGFDLNELTNNESIPERAADEVEVCLNSILSAKYISFLLASWPQFVVISLGVMSLPLFFVSIFFAATYPVFLAGFLGIHFFRRKVERDVRAEVDMIKSRFQENLENRFRLEVDLKVFFFVSKLEVSIFGASVQPDSQQEFEDTEVGVKEETGEDNEQTSQQEETKNSFSEARSYLAETKPLRAIFQQTKTFSNSHKNEDGGDTLRNFDDRVDASEIIDTQSSSIPQIREPGSLPLGWRMPSLRAPKLQVTRKKAESKTIDLFKPASDKENFYN